MKKYFVIRWYGKGWLSSENISGFLYDEDSEVAKEFQSEEEAEEFLTENPKMLREDYQYHIAKMFKKVDE